ncbi:MAG: hypothetical protein ABIQ29_07690 [Burkholderiaceae bacterium]
MLRLLVVVLALANLGLWAWQSGVLDGVGLGPTRERDPSRRVRQVRPESLRILPSAVPAPAPSPASAPFSGAPAEPGASPRAGSETVAVLSLSAAAASLPGSGGPGMCFEAGPWAASGADEAERMLANSGLPAGSWQRLRQDVTAQYAVVLGPFNSRESVQVKREELGRLRLVGEEIAWLPEGSAASVAPRSALALARYDARSAAEAGLAAYSQRGVRTARVTQLRSAGTEYRLRVPAASPALSEQLRRFSGSSFGPAFQPCEAAR